MRKTKGYWTVKNGEVVYVMPLNEALELRKAIEAIGDNVAELPTRIATMIAEDQAAHGEIIIGALRAGDDN